MSRKSLVNHAEFVRLWSSGVSGYEVAQNVGLSLSATYEYAARHRSECCKRGRLPEKMHKQRIRMYRKGMTVAEISRKLGVSKQAISHYLKMYGYE